MVRASNKRSGATPGANASSPDDARPARVLPGRPKFGEIERRKITILETAAQLFLSQGYAATSLVDIARKAQAGTKTLYQHFGDKEGLFREVVLAREHIMPFLQPRLLEGETLSQALERMGEEAWDYLLDRRTIDMMRLRIAESQRFAELMRKLATSSQSRFRVGVTRTFEMLAEQGQIPRGNSEEAAKFFLDLIIGSAPLMIYSEWDSVRPQPAEIKAKVRLFIRGQYGEEFLEPAAKARKKA